MKACYRAVCRELAGNLGNHASYTEKPRAARMSDDRKANDVNADVNVVTAKPFAAMTGAEKVKYVAKVVVFLVTFGFVFPNILID